MRAACAVVRAETCSAAPRHGCRTRSSVRRVMAELRDLTDRELADIGLSRGEISRVFDPSFVRRR